MSNEFMVACSGSTMARNNNGDFIFDRVCGVWDISEQPKPKIKQCAHCGSRCDDMRGNCGACGAPKHEEMRFGVLWS